MNRVGVVFLFSLLIGAQFADAAACSREQSRKGCRTVQTNCRQYCDTPPEKCDYIDGVGSICTPSGIPECHRVCETRCACSNPQSFDEIFDVTMKVEKLNQN